MTQIMAPLPVDRLTPDEPPFSRIGIDYFGPMQVRVGRSTPKRWGVIFTCFNSRAVHFEVSHSLDTDSFLGALSRFTARRGVPKFIVSDNGTNLTSAERELQQMIGQLDRPKLQSKYAGVTWKFLPPHPTNTTKVDSLSPEYQSQ